MKSDARRAGGREAPVVQPRMTGRPAASRWGIVLLVAVLAAGTGTLSCIQEPDRTLRIYKPEKTCDGITLFGIISQIHLFGISYGYMNALPMVSEYPLPSPIQPLWEFRDDPGGPISDVDLMPGGTILATRGFYRDMVEIDPRTNETLWVYDDLLVHHDTEVLPDGTILFLYRTTVEDPDFGLMCVENLGVVDRDKNLLWSWSLHENDPEGNPRPECPPDLVTLFPSCFEWDHSNGFDFVPDPEWQGAGPLTGSIYLSARNFNRVYRVGYPDGEIKWVLGDGGDFGQSFFSHAHGVDVTVETDPAGGRAARILLFDNGRCRPGGDCPPDEASCPPDIGPYSRFLEIEVRNGDDPARWSASILWKWPSPSSPDFTAQRFYSAIGGDADRLPNGNVLGTISVEGGDFYNPSNPGHSRYVELVPGPGPTEAETVWEVVTTEGYGSFRAQRIPVEDWPF